MVIGLFTIIQLGFLSILFSCVLTCLLILSINKFVLKHKTQLQKIENILPINKYLTQNTIAIISTFILTFIIGFLLFYGVVGLSHAFTMDNIPNPNIPDFIVNAIPDDVAEIKKYGVDFISSHLTSIGNFGKTTITHFVYIIIGFIIGVMISFHVIANNHKTEHLVLKKQLLNRIKLFKTSFENVFVAQVKISAINTLLTGAYLYIILPIFGISIPFKFIIVLITFFAGLIPVIGNLISNTVIIIFSFGVSIYTAIASLVFLVVIHKLEYFLNAKIIGSKINSSAWELLLVMILFEHLFGIAGVITAPIYYAYLKSELQNVNLI